MNAIQFLIWGRNNLHLVVVIGDAAAALPAADSMVDRWEIVKPVGDQLAPAADELIGTITASADSEDDLTAKLLAEIEATPKVAGLFDGKRDGAWLNGAIELAKVLLPILLQRAVK